MKKQAMVVCPQPEAAESGIEILRAAHIDPVPELLHAHLLLRRRHADVAEPRGQFRARQADQRRLRQRHIGFKRGFFEDA